MSNRPKFAKSNDGVAAIEFAIVVPLLLLFVFGIIAYGVYFGAAHSVQQLAANSARAAMGGLDMEERQELVHAYVTTALEEGGLLLDDHVGIQVSANEERSDFLVVTVSYDASELPVWNLYNGLPMPEKTITRTSLIRAGGY
ncbi:TadE/TadG family type IV pilus assembly protein [Henriciella sp. AS95]|uniref:TadE/TadG family type IV pilus assembly protein n=1 Tax=Henriciella sp. AS95 TaxID=3135782 RepID=UPI00317E9199